MKIPTPTHRTAQAEYDQIYQRLPQLMRERYEAGYETKDTIDDAIRAISVQDAGISDYFIFESHKDEPVERLDDDEFSALKHIKANVAENTEVTACIAHPVGGQLGATSKGPVTAARLEWEHAGLTIRIWIRLDEISSKGAFLESRVLG